MSLYWCVAKRWLRFRASVFKLWFLFHKKRREKEVGREKQEQRKGLRNWKKEKEDKSWEKTWSATWKAFPLPSHSFKQGKNHNFKHWSIENWGWPVIFKMLCLTLLLFFPFLNRKAPDLCHREELATGVCRYLLPFSQASQSHATAL